MIRLLFCTLFYCLGWLPLTVVWSVSMVNYALPFPVGGVMTAELCAPNKYGTGWMLACKRAEITFSYNALRAQSPAGEKNLDRAFLLQAGYGVHTAAGDLSDRFDGGFAVDGGVAYTPARSNWQFGVRAHFGFGNTVEDDVLADLRTRDGFLIGNQRTPANVQLRQRYLFVGPSVGYTLSIGDNQRSGVLLRTALGYLRHWIHVQADPSQGVQPLLPERIAGYDRLTGGPSLHQFVGYQLLSRNRSVNFYIGVEALLAFTRPLRAFDVPTGTPLPDATRNDIILGARAGIIVPIYAGEGREIYYR